MHTDLSDFSKPYITDIAITGSVDSGKCFAPSTLVCTQTGLKMIRHICVGDYVVGDDYKYTRVLHVHSGKSNMYAIHTTDGKKYTVSDDHILCLMSNNDSILEVETNAHASVVKKNGILELSINEYIKLPQNIKEKLMWYRHITDKSYIRGYKPEQVSFTVEKENFGEYYGFTIGGNGRFLLDDYSVVHNSSFVVNLWDS